MNTTIRPIQVADASLLSDLVEQYWRFEQIDGFEKSQIMSRLELFLSESRFGMGWLAFDGLSPVGYLLAVYIFSLEQGGLTAEIDELYVAPDQRGVGIGAHLLRKAEQDLKQAGCRSIALQLGRDNDLGRAFYAKQGYAPRDGYELLDKNL